MLHTEKVKLKAHTNNIHEIELFVEKVCDQYNILNSYFGNIMFAVTQTFLYAAEHAKNKNSYITVSYLSDTEGLVFNISLGDYYYELAAVFQRDTTEELEKENLNQDDQNVLIIRLLCDDVRFNDQLHAVQLVFYIASINEHLTKERLKELDMYYNKISQHHQIIS